MFTEAQPHSNPAAKVFSREQLYELVWSTPVLRAARQLEVSNSYVARICSALDVPRPPRGWWARKKSGQTPVRPPLPPPRPGRPLSWSKEEWSGSITMYYQRREIWEASAKGMHPLVALATEAFSSAKARSSDTYLAPRANNVMDIVTTPGTLERALAFANLLSAALETRGHSIMVAAKWRFIRPCIDGWERPPTHCDVASIRKWAPRWPTVPRCVVRMSALQSSRPFGRPSCGIWATDSSNPYRQNLAKARSGSPASPGTIGSHSRRDV